MSIQYFTNNIVLLASTVPRTCLDIDRIFIEEKEVKQYRGSVNISKSNFSIKLTKNSHAYIFIKNNFSFILKDITKFVSEACLDLFTRYSKTKFTDIKVHILNIQISISISIENKSLKLIEVFLKINDRLKDQYQLKIKESNTFESVWLPYSDTKHSNIVFLSAFRITNKDITFTISHNFVGTCITKETSIFLDLCSCINTAITELTLNKESVPEK